MHVIKHHSIGIFSYRLSCIFPQVLFNNHHHYFFFQLLAMIEEAAGTRMYECKKIGAQKTIEKKEAKLKEIQTVCPDSSLI